MSQLCILFGINKIWKIFPFRYHHDNSTKDRNIICQQGPCDPTHSSVVICCTPNKYTVLDIITTYPQVAKVILVSCEHLENYINLKLIKWVKWLNIVNIFKNLVRVIRSFQDFLILLHEKKIPNLLPRLQLSSGVVKNYNHQ